MNTKDLLSLSTDPDSPLLWPAISKRPKKHRDVDSKHPHVFINTHHFYFSSGLLIARRAVSPDLRRRAGSSPASSKRWPPSLTARWLAEGAGMHPSAWLESLNLRCCQMGNICNQWSLLTKKEGRKIKTENREYAWLIKILCAWAHNELDRWYKQTNEKGSKGNRMKNKIHPEQRKLENQTRCGYHIS